MENKSAVINAVEVFSPRRGPATPTQRLHLFPTDLPLSESIVAVLVPLNAGRVLHEPVRALALTKPNKIRTKSGGARCWSESFPAGSQPKNAKSGRSDRMPPKSVRKRWRLPPDGRLTATPRLSDSDRILHRKSLQSKRGWGGWIRTNAWRSQSPLPYRLATPHRRTPFRHVGRPYPEMPCALRHARLRRATQGDTGDALFRVTLATRYSG